MALPLLRRDTALTAPDEKFRLWCITDTHLGNKATNETALYNLIQHIAADDHAYWIAGGDKGEFINITDRRFDPADCVSWVQVSDLGNLAQRQADRYLELTRPIWSKCLFSLDGNHEGQIYKRYHFDVGAVVAGKMGVPHYRQGAWLRWTFTRTFANKRHVDRPLDIVALHGWGGGRTKGAKANMMTQALIAYNADLIMLGHVHYRGRVPAISYTATRMDVTTRRRVAVCCGGFLDGAGYSLEAGYEPAEIGSVEVELFPDLRGIEVRL